MNFLSLIFLGFAILVIGIYYLVQGNMQKYILLLANLCFAISYGKKNTIFLFGMILISWCFGNFLNKKKSKGMLTVSIVCSLLPLLIFKYSPIDLSGILVPVGISFFTFRMISYLAEIYKGKVNPAGFVDYAIYISFFPTLISGPIDRPQEFLPQIEFNEKISPKDEDFKTGFLWVLYGFLLKMVLADRLAIIVNTVFVNWGGYSGFALLFTSFLYTIQIYCDFAGYTYIAIGIAKMMGLNCKQNFMQPYFATSIQDFWRRWHISLSTWLRDYVYIPLGGNRKGIMRKYINLMITFLVSGLWHGAGIKFLFWGGVHGALQIGGAVTASVRKKMKDRIGLTGSKWEKWISVLITFFLINITWVIFWGSSFHASAHILLNMFKPSAITFTWIHALGVTDTQIVVMLLIIVIMHVIDAKKEKKQDIVAWFWNLVLPVRWIILITAIVVIVVYGTYGPGYNAASFIYFQF